MTIVDDGLSRNGSYLNGERVFGHRRLRDGDLLRLGATVLVYRAPGQDPYPTAVLDAAGTAPSLSATQRRVLVALCRPCKGAVGPSAPASNREIAAEVHLSVEAVKAHLRALFSKFSIPNLPHTRKRLRLVARGVQHGGDLAARAVGPSQLGSLTALLGATPAATTPPRTGRRTANASRSRATSTGTWRSTSWRRTVRCPPRAMLWGSPRFAQPRG